MERRQERGEERGEIDVREEKNRRLRRDRGKRVVRELE